MLPDANVTPAVETPVRMWITTSSGMVSTCFSGRVVKVHRKIDSTNRGAATVKTPLFETLSAIRPQAFSTAMLAAWLTINSAVTMVTLRPKRLYR